MISTLYKQRKTADPQAQRLLHKLQANGFPQLTALRLEKALRAEGIPMGELSRLAPLFCQPVVEQLATQPFLSDSALEPVVEISYKRSITDPELESVRHAARALGVPGLAWARLATRYQFCGVNAATAQEIARRFLYNPQVQTIIAPGETWPTLIPQGQAGPVEEIELAPLTVSELHRLADVRRLFLSDEQMLAIQRFFIREEKRPIRDGELEMLAARWSDHCSHTTWRSLGLLSDLQEATRRINHPLVYEAFIDNAGKMLFYGGYVILIKGETHISPTFGGDPYGGIMTKHGGVIRDVIFAGRGAYPIAGTTIMAICDPRIPWDQVPAGAIHPLVVLAESIRGTHDYTNPMGIPMAWSQYLVDHRNWKGFALGHSLGIMPESRAAKGQPRAGDFVVLIGGPTGIDGIHGATVSSGAITESTVVRDAAHVQIGMPIEERKFMEAVPRLRDADCIIACTDCGAAGLSSAIGELGEDTGVWVNLAWVPLKCATMRKWEIWLSESQERGILCVPPEKLPTALAILANYGVPTAAIGVFTASYRCQVVYNATLNHKQWQLRPEPELTGEVVVDLPYSFLSGGCPLPHVKVREPKTKLEPFNLNEPKGKEEWVKLIQKHLGHFNLSDQSAAAHRFDQTVQGNTVLTYMGGPDERMPDELFVTAPLFPHNFGMGCANAVNQRYGDIDPAALGRLMMAGACSKLVAAGFSPNDITACANVYTPPVVGSPENAWRLEKLVRSGYIPASEELRIPIISGKDSSSGRFRDTDAPITLDILAVGRMPDAARLIPKAFRQPGDHIVLYHPGLKQIALGGSVLFDQFGHSGNQLPAFDLSALRTGWLAYHQYVVEAGYATARSAIGEGGLIRRLFEMAYGGGLGCYIDLDSDPLLWLFAELHGAILFTTNLFLWDLGLDSNDYTFLGYVTKEPTIGAEVGGKTLFLTPISALAELWQKTFTEVAE